MVKELFELLKKNNLTLVAVESITGGKFSNLLVNEEGASSFFKGSFICYSNKFKYDILKVSKDIDVVSFEMAKQLAFNSRKLMNSNLAISFTGNSSENGIENKKKGLSYIAISNNSSTEVIEYLSSKETRSEIIEDTAFFGIVFLLNFIRQKYK